MIKPLRVLIMYAALIILAVIWATFQTIRTEVAANNTYTETSTAVYLEEHPWTFTHANLDPLAGSLTNSDEY